VKQPVELGSESLALHALLEGSADISLSMLVITPARLLNLTTIPSPEPLQYSLLIHKRFLSQEGALANGIISNVFQPAAWATLVMITLLLFLGTVLSAKLRAMVFRKNISWKKMMLDISLGQITSSFSEYE
jgi:hypothetical protein